MKSKNSNL